MNNIIEINSIKYIKMSEYDKLKKTKVKIKVEKEETIKLKDYYILDPSNVGMIYPIKINPHNEVLEELETEMGFFKRIDSPKITGIYNNNNLEGVEVLTINGSNYSKDYIDNFIKMASVWYSGDYEIFMMYDKKKEEFKKNNPIMFIFDWKICFVLAPRVESEDEDDN